MRLLKLRRSAEALAKAEAGHYVLHDCGIRKHKTERTPAKKGGACVVTPRGAAASSRSMPHTVS
jgi:hypothetical protein